jgi:hypothetical protein
MTETVQKRFRVAGYDEDGDIQAFESDSEERARDVFEQMQEELTEVSWFERGE